MTISSKKYRGWFWLVENPCGWFQMSQLLPPLTKSQNLKFDGNDLKSVQEFQQFWASPCREDLPGWLLTHATHLSIVLSLDILLYTTFNAVPTKVVTKMLQVLDLGFNLLRSLPSSAFRGITSLTLLALDGNPLATLPEEVFAHLNTSLRGLSLGGRFALLHNCFV